jgi:phosphate transport system substrate-binding protein
MKKIFLSLIFLLLFLLGACTGNKTPAGDTLDQGEMVSIVNKGSDTMVNLALAWAERYQQVNSNVSISVTGGGSGTGIAALINKTVDIANASRQIKTEELDAAKENGADPVEFVVARDAIAVIVNPGNPINRLTLQQISDIYSGKINNWQELGGEDRPLCVCPAKPPLHMYILEEVLSWG